MNNTIFNSRCRSSSSKRNAKTCPQERGGLGFTDAKEGEKERKVDRDRIFWAEGIAYSRAWKDV